MIIKLVYGKEIHVYDLKENESLDNLVVKVKDLFKKVPSQFILVYKNPQQQMLKLTTNEEMKLLIDSIKNEVKILKLLIEQKNQRYSTETKSDKRLEVKPEIEFQEMTQKIQCIDDTDQQAEQITKLSSSNEQTKPLNQSSSESINSPTQLIANEPRSTSNQEFIFFEKLLEQREQPSQRQINLSNGQSSDPKELRNSTSNQFKQNLLQNSPSIQPSCPLISQEKEIIQKPLISEQPEQPIANQHIEDDFLSHNARCDICNIFPICGTRYKCVVCQNYDLCANCQQKHGHDHPVLKIRYTFQTPLNIKVDIPEYRQRPKLSPKFISQKINLQELTPKERRERVLSLSSEIAELLNRDLQECMNFVQTHQEYTKETLIQALIEHRDPANLIKVERKKENENQGVLKGFINNLKGYIFSTE